MSGGHDIPFIVPIEYGLNVLSTGWQFMKAYTFDLGGGIELNLQEIFIGTALIILAIDVIHKIFDW